MNNTPDLPFDYGHTCMNRFAVLDLRQVAAPPSRDRLAALARALCASPFADDLLVIEPSTHAAARLRIVGGDGREADFCANGLIYVAAKLGRELGGDQVRIETPAGIR
ncbi:MAG: Diaminopimelate epimerase, partial [Pseudomonadota bacterium]